MVQVNGTTIHVEQMAPARAARQTQTPPGPAGHSPPIAVMIHGLGPDSLASWYFTLAKPFADAGFRVIMYDLRGHGRSERPPTGYRLEDFVDDLEALLARLAVQGPIHLLGNSFGGTIAFAYAARCPWRVASITAVESAPPVPEWFRRINARLDRAARYLPREGPVAERGTEPGVGHDTGHDTGRDNRGQRWFKATHDLLVSTSLASDIAASARPAESAVAAIACPVLCIYGGESRVSELAPVVRELLPQTRTVVVPGGKHFVLLDEARSLRRLILSWMSQAQDLPSWASQDGGVDAGHPAIR